MKGQFELNKRNATGVQKGVEYFRQAVAIDPDYALAYVGLADSFNYLTYFASVPPAEACPKAEAAARRAIELDETLGEAHQTLAWVRAVCRWDWVGAEQEFALALKLSPGSAPAHRRYGWFLALLGRYDEGVAEARRAREADPFSVIEIRTVGFVF